MIVVGNLAKDLLIWTGGLAISVVKSTFGAFFDLGNIAGNVIGELVADTIENFLDSIKSNSSYAKAIEGFKDAIEENENFGAKIERILAELTDAESVEECFPSGRGFKARKERKRFQRALQGKFQTIALLASRNGIDGALGELSKTYCGLDKKEKSLFRDVFDNVYHQTVSLLTQDMSAADKRMVAVLGFMINMNAEMTRSFASQYPQGIITLSEGKARFTHYACAQCGSGSEALIDLDDGYICIACGQRTKITDVRTAEISLPRDIVEKINNIEKTVNLTHEGVDRLLDNAEKGKTNEEKKKRQLIDALSFDRPDYDSLVTRANDVRSFDPDNVYAALAYFVNNPSSPQCKIDFLEAIENSDVSDETADWMIKVVTRFISDYETYSVVSGALVKKISDPVLKAKNENDINDEKKKLKDGYYEAHTDRDLFVIYAEAYSDRYKNPEVYDANRESIKKLVTALESQGITCFVSFLNTKWQRNELYKGKLDIAESNCMGALVLFSDYFATRSNLESIKEMENIMHYKYCPVRLQYKMPGTKYTVAQEKVTADKIDKFFGEENAVASQEYIDSAADPATAATYIIERYLRLRESYTEKQPRKKSSRAGQKESSNATQRMSQSKPEEVAEPVAGATETYSPEWVKDKTFIGQVPETIAKLIFKSGTAWTGGTVQVFPQYLRDQVAEISNVDGADGFLYNGIMLRRLRKKAGAGDPRAMYLLAKRYVGLYKRLRRKSDKINNAIDAVSKAEHFSAVAKAAAKAKRLLAAAAVLHNYMPAIERYSKDYIYDYQEKAELLSYAAVSGNAELLPKAMQIGDRWTCSLPVGKSREVHSGNLALVGDYYAILSQSNDDKWAAMYYACSSYAARYYNIDAYDGLDDCYSTGKGTKQNKKRAVKYRLAAFLNLNPRIWLLYAITICVSALCMWMIYVNYFSPRVIPLQYAPTLASLCVLPIAWILFLLNLVNHISLARHFEISRTVCSWIIMMLVGISVALPTGQFRGFSFVDAPYVFYTDTYVTNDPDSWWVELYGDYENETELVFPSKVGDCNIRVVNDNACAGMTSLESIVIPVEIEGIGDNAFNGCISLEYVYYGGTAEEWARMIIEPGNDELLDATVYFYSEEEPPLVEDGSAYDGNYWHWVDGRAAVWTPTASATS